MHEGIRTSWYEINDRRARCTFLMKTDICFDDERDISLATRIDVMAISHVDNRRSGQPVQKREIIHVGRDSMFKGRTDGYDVRSPLNLLADLLRVVLPDLLAGRGME